MRTPRLWVSASPSKGHCKEQRGIRKKLCDHCSDSRIESLRALVRYSDFPTTDYRSLNTAVIERSRGCGGRYAWAEGRVIGKL